VREEHKGGKEFLAELIEVCFNVAFRVRFLNILYCLCHVSIMLIYTETIECSSDFLLLAVVNMLQIITVVVVVAVTLVDELETLKKLNLSTLYRNAEVFIIGLYTSIYGANSCETERQMNTFNGRYVISDTAHKNNESLIFFEAVLP
jgi:hypothetical protein